MPYVSPVVRAAYQREYRRTHRAKFRAYDAARSEEQRRARYRRYWLKHGERIRRERRVAYAANPRRRLDQDLLRVYGIGPDEYRAMLLAQDGVCAICRQQSKRTLAVDHDHRTGLVRGLLCTYCNVAVGVFEGKRAAAITSYLEKHSGYSGNDHHKRSDGITGGDARILGQ